MNSLTVYDYQLPAERIAQIPMTPREAANLMVVDRKAQRLQHKHVSDLPSLFHPDDVVVINNTKVFHARLTAKLPNTPSPIELFLVRPMGGTSWLCLGKPGKKLLPGTQLSFASDFSAVVTDKRPDGTLSVDFGNTATDVMSKANTYGTVPVPPYIKTIPNDADYQTVYAKTVGSVAAPTAGFHLTKNILQQLQAKGVTILEITLHVGLGTFLPIKTDSLESHTMHAEWAEVTPHVAQTIMQAKNKQKRIVAIGTTTVRTLEGIAIQHNGIVSPFSGDIDLFIKPGFQFHIVDAMLTNFHLPKSTLLVLVATFGGHELIMAAYHEAIANNYRFYSFGDAMLIL